MNASLHKIKTLTGFKNLVKLLLGKTICLLGPHLRFVGTGGAREHVHSLFFGGMDQNSPQILQIRMATLQMFCW